MAKNLMQEAAFSEQQKVFIGLMMLKHYWQIVQTGLLMGLIKTMMVIMKQKTAMTMIQAYIQMQ